MADQKKTLYHSEAAALGSIQCVIKSDILHSKYEGKPDYCILVASGVERNYSTENEACAAALRGRKGQSVTLTFLGSRDDATIQVAGGEALSAAKAPATAPPTAQQQQQQQSQSQSQSPPPQRAAPPQAAPEDGVRQAGMRIMKFANLLDKNLDAAVWLSERFAKKHPNQKQMTTEDIRSIAMSLQIASERAGLADLMPTTQLK